jgi:DNA-binding response OmpR family regulator
MSRIVSAKEMDLIEQVISEHTEGIGISAIEKALGQYLSKPINRRTLQRRLKALIKEKRIGTEGESIALV